MASVAHAGVIPIFDTGVNTLGIPLANGTVGDPHYLLISVPSGTTILRVRRSVGSSPTFPIPPWLGDDALSTWIGPSSDNSLDGPPGTYDFRTTFNLTGFAPDTARLIGQWAADNSGVILINGVATGSPSLGFAAFTNFSINSGFIAGVNTLDFIVTNGPSTDGTLVNPVGLRVEVTGTAFTPEPGSLVLFGAGFAVLCMFRRRLRVN